MATLLYRGFNDEGRGFGGARGFASKAQLEDYLRKQGISHFEIFTSKTVYKTGLYKQISPKELSVFCKQMSVLFFSHITLMEGVQTLAEQTDNKQLKLALNEIHGFMMEGRPFAETIGMYSHIFPPYLLSMITIGETSGTLDAVFARMSDYFDKESKTRKKLRAAITYPAVLTGLMAAIVALLITKILPMFGDILRSMGAEIPPATAAILNGGLFFTSYGLVILAVVLVLILAWVAFIRTRRGRDWFDKAKFAIPAYRYTASRVITARFARSMAILLKSGVQLSNALTDVTALMDNRFLEGKLTEAIQKMKEGAMLSDLLAEIGVFPVLFVKMFNIGQKTGNLDEMLDKSASVFDDEVDEAVERLTAMLEPTLIIVLSVIVGVILLSVILPMITVMNAIG